MGCSLPKGHKPRSSLHNSHQYKIVLLGNAAVGKTSIMRRFCLGSFQEEYEVSIGGTFQQKAIVLYDDVPITLNIWDTAGQERFKSLMPLYFRDAQAALVVFDLTDEESLSGCEYWFNEVHKTRGGKCLMGLVGNKLDSPDRKVTATDVEPILRQHNLEYFETSARTNANIDMVFTRIATQLLRRGHS